MKPSVKLSVEDLTKEPYASILSYPQNNPSEVEKRISELKELKVKEIEFRGGELAANIPVIGKGHVGIVVIGYVKKERVALKIRRLDSSRENFFHEAKMLEKANLVEVGPKFVAVSKNFLLTQFIDGNFLAKWLEDNRESEGVYRVIEDILEQCWRLDEVGLDHGELTKASKHLLLDKMGKPFIVDFETASIRRRAANVTSVSHHLFFGNHMGAKLIEEMLKEKNKDQLINALQDYKNLGNRKNFENLVQISLSQF